MPLWFLETGNTFSSQVTLPPHPSLQSKSAQPKRQAVDASSPKCHSEEKLQAKESGGTEPKALPTAIGRASGASRAHTGQVVQSPPGTAHFSLAIRLIKP